MLFFVRYALLSVVDRQVDGSSVEPCPWVVDWGGLRHVADERLLADILGVIAVLQYLRSCPRPSRR